MWKPLLGENIIQDEDSFTINAEERSKLVAQESVSFPHEICDGLCRLLADSDDLVNKSKKHIVQWFETDDSDCGWEPLNDEGIVNLLTSGEVGTRAENDVEDENSNEMCQEDKICPSKGLECLQTFKSWMLSSEATAHHHDCLEVFEIFAIEKQ